MYSGFSILKDFSIKTSRLARGIPKNTEIDARTTILQGTLFKSTVLETLIVARGIRNYLKDSVASNTPENWDDPRKVGIHIGSQGKSRRRARPGVREN